ncbi:hypothetical protein [Pseudomonas sp. FP2338]|uniref:hypothetical protein n=1 Tax=Pseudomonas sp. FP2338 TaxID=2954093 RepID=UPI0027370361|nr:hypothetical protein [Pseudomonas sp. FP2338]WLH83976.1 hypothetical protein PSH96_24740 [Pseudomonas sp. FP2338]
MGVLPIYVFKNSFSALLGAISEGELHYQIRETRSAAPLASSGVIELLLSPGVWAAVAAVLVAFMHRRRGCKVIITTKEKTIIHAEGLTQAELEKVLSLAQRITIAEARSTDVPDF